MEKMRKKLFYVAPTVTVTRVMLENRIAVQCSPVNPKGIDVYEWEAQAENLGDIWVPL